MHSHPLSRSWQTLRALWQREFAVYSSPDADSAAIRARHMQSIGRLTPAMMVATGAGSLLLATSLASVVPGWPLPAWLALMWLVCGAALLNWWQHRDSRPRSASPKAIARTVRGGVVLSLLWSSAAVLWLPGIPHDQQLLLSTLMVGMMCGGAFALTSVPQAAWAYLAIMTAGSVIALARSDGSAPGHLIVMVLIYDVVLSLCVLINARIYTARLISERESERQGELVGLLLRDFEEHSADLLWEIGADGRFTRASQRLAVALGSNSTALQHRELLKVLDERDGDSDGAGQAHRKALADAMARGRPFRDLLVPVQTAAGLRWWSITARPLSAGGGAGVGWRGVIADVTSARQAQERLEHLAHFDSLTGLANRLQLQECLQTRLQRKPSAASAGDVAALFCVDVDHFKSINDSLGHVAGDAVLREVARRLRSKLRPADLAARLGGDEFALLIDHVQGEAQAEALAQRLVQALAEPFAVMGHAVPLSASVGVALAPTHGTSPEALLANADLALYAAKESARGSHVLFSPRLGDRHRRQVLIAQELRQALARGELSLAWQPQVRIDGWRVVGAEVLLRWQHPQLGAVPPAEFVPIAEDTGQIHAIGTWVLEQACAGAAGLPEGISVSVNASPAQLMRADFVSAVTQALVRSKLPAARLKIEITESLFMDAVPVALANLHGLRALGVQIALDDFGTGFSSLAYLLRFPFDVLKIDRAFVLELMARDDARALVLTIVQMARTLGMGTVAEGVEDSAQLELLRQAGCEAIQGYFVARPMPLSQLKSFLAGWSTQPLALVGATQKLVA